MTVRGRPHLTTLGHPDWAAWRDVVLRSTGFPASVVDELTDPELAAAADAVINGTGSADAGRATYHETYRAGTDRLSAAIRRVATTPRFREAIAWQNPKLIKLCLDRVAAGEPRNVRGRNHERTVASYLQRYGLKNDTIGFVGPVGWARWTDEGAPFTVTTGSRFLTRRTVYFEAWAMEAVARTLSADPAVRPWLAPRVPEEYHFDGVVLHVPNRKSVTLRPAERSLLSLVDGRRSVLDIAALLPTAGFPDLGEPAAVLALLDAMAERGLVRLDLANGIETWPERTLLARLDRIGDTATRERTTARVHHLIAARDRVAAAAGDAEALEAAQAELGSTFRDFTGTDEERRSGETYAGRTLVYEDTVRDVRIALGPELREELSRPLRLLLDSARWLVAEAGAEFDQAFHQYYERRAAQLGSPVVPLPSVLSLATPMMYYSSRRLSKPVLRAIDEFQRRWASILRIPADSGGVQRSSDDLADRIAKLFPPRPLPWATGMFHSPDFMLAADDAAAVDRGDYLFVLGELHVSFNTMESRLFVEQHDDPPSLLAAAEADLGDRRIYSVPGKDLPGVTSRVSPPSALLSPGYTYWARHPVAAHPPGPVIPAADLFVHREDGELVVRSSGGFAAPLVQVVGEHLAAAVLNAFKPLTHGPHSPRVTIDRLVIARESWSFRAADVAWVTLKSEADRFLAAREWRLRHGLPERAFYKVPVEDKPTFVDFGSLVYVDLLAKSIRRSAQEENGSVSLTETLPDRSQLWLRDADGARYTSEFRICAVDLRAPIRSEAGSQPITEIRRDR